MLIDRNGQIIEDKYCKKYEFDDFAIYMSGFFYISGHTSGDDSVLLFSEKINDDIPFEICKGNFTCVLKFYNGNVVCFSSNGSMSCFYYGFDTVSNSYIDLLEYLKESDKELIFNDESICEYYTLGKVFFNKTHIKGVSILDNESYIAYTPGLGWNVEKKGIGEIDEKKDTFDPYKFFDDLNTALRTENVSIALTGGYDSRAIFSQLYKKTPLKIFYATNNEQDVEKTVAERVVSKVDRDIEIIRTPVDKLTESYIWDMIVQLDGLQRISLESGKRILHFRNNLKSAGYTLQITGDGGVLHKDWEWMQDLPFYHKRKTNIKRFYYQRISYETRNDRIGERIIDYYRNLEKRFCSELEKYRKETNTKSYDFLYYYVSGNSNYMFNLGRLGYLAYAPFFEYDFVRYSYNLPRRKRFFYNFLREITTSGNKKIARIPTIYGTTASSETRYIIRDIFFQTLDYVKKAIRLVGRKVFRKSFFNSKTVDWNYYDELKKMPLCRKVMSWANDNKIVEKGDISYGSLLRLVHIYMISIKFDVRFKSE